MYTPCVRSVENKTTSLPRDLFTPFSRPLPACFVVPLPFSRWLPSHLQLLHVCIILVMHTARRWRERENRIVSHLLPFWPSSPSHRYRPHTFSFGLSARGRKRNDRVEWNRERRERERREEERRREREMKGSQRDENDSARTPLRVSPNKGLVLSPLLIGLALLGHEIDSPKPRRRFSPLFNLLFAWKRMAAGTVSRLLIGDESCRRF